MSTEPLWTDERVVDLHNRWRNGESASGIAKLYSKAVGRLVSRNAIIGKIHRSLPKGDAIRLPASAPRPRQPRPDKGIRMPAPAPKPKASAVMVIKPAAAGKTETGVVVVPSGSEKGKNALHRFEALRPGLSVSLLALEEGMCKRPSGGAGADTLYCGNRTDRKRGGYDSFCVQCKITLNQPSPRARNDHLAFKRPKTLSAAPRWGQING